MEPIALDHPFNEPTHHIFETIYTAAIDAILGMPKAKLWATANNRDNFHAVVRAEAENAAFASLYAGWSADEVPACMLNDYLRYNMEGSSDQPNHIVRQAAHAVWDRLHNGNVLVREWPGPQLIRVEFLRDDNEAVYLNVPIYLLEDSDLEKASFLLYQLIRNLQITGVSSPHGFVLNYEANL